MDSIELRSPQAYELAITTFRSPEKLARAHGFRNVQDLADSLPPAARVLDIGAGDSLLGAEVARLNKDITWINFDLSYTSEPEAVERLRAQSPPNVEYVAGDATCLAELYEPESVDAVFSYWLFGHLSLDALEPARRVAEGIFAITKPGALQSIGPALIP